MPLLSDREAFDRAAMRKIEDDWKRIGELVQTLAYYGELHISSGLDTDTQEYGHYVEWRDEWSTVSYWADSLLDALEKVEADVEAL